MDKINNIFLPGNTEQITLLLNNFDPSNKKILLIGTELSQAADMLSNKFKADVDIIVEEYDSLIRERMQLTNNAKVNVRIMDFELTDFQSNYFDLVYAQASISNPRRNKIIKEIKRILKPEKYFCVGELVKKIKPVPKFIDNYLNNSFLSPLFVNDITDYYSQRNFKVIYKKDLSGSLEHFYELSKSKLIQIIPTLDEKQKSYYKKLLHKINHESNIYLKMGGTRYIGFLTMLLEKEA